MKTILERLWTRMNVRPVALKANSRRPIRNKPRLERLEDRVVPATDFWTGAAGTGLWSTAGNWASGIAPVNGDTIVFETNLVTASGGTTLAPASAYTTVDDINNLQVETIIFDNGSRYALPANNPFAEGGPAQTGTVGYTINGGAASGHLIINNTAFQTDGILIQPGVNSPVSLGQPIAGFTETFGANLPLEVITPAAEFADLDNTTATPTTNTQLTINGTLKLIDLATSITFLDIDVAGGAANNAAVPGVNLNGVVSDSGVLFNGDGALVKNGTGTLLLAQVNTFGNDVDGVLVNSGVVIVAQSNAAASGLGLNTIDSGDIIPVETEVLGDQTPATDGQILLENGVTVGQAVYLDSEASGGGVTTDGSATLSGLPSNIGDPAGLVLSDGPDTSALGTMGAASLLTVSGVISGGGDGTSGTTQSNLIIEGTGTTEFTNNNTYLGTTEIQAGTLIVDGSQPQSPVVMNPPALGTATLSGTGTVGTITTPGAGVSIVSPGDSLGTLSVNGDATFAANSQYVVLLGGFAGDSSSSDFSRLDSSGAATLNGAFLKVSVPGSFPNSTTFDILHAKIGVSGEFTGLVGGVPTLLANGAIFVSPDGTILQINYTTNDVVLTVLSPTTTTTVVGVPNPVVFGNSVTFTATVTNVSPAGGTPTGSVAFYDNGVFIGNGTALTPTGATTAISTFTTTTLPSGPQPITAVYTASGDFLNSVSPIYTEDVLAVTVSNLISSLNPSTVGDPVIFTDTITNTSDPTTSPTAGQVQFFSNGNLFDTETTLVGGGNTVTVTSAAISSLAAGVDTITAVYTPAAGTDFVGSTGTLLQTVEAHTAVSASGVPNPVVFGQPVVLSATVTNLDGTNGTPTGAVEFFDNLVDLGAGIAAGGGVYNLPATTALPSGPQTITAVYTPTGAFVGSSGTFTEDVLAGTTSALSSSLNPSNFGQSVTFTDVISNTSGAASPTGSVEFFDGAIDLGPGTVLTGSGNTVTSTFTTSTLPAGVDAISAVYTPTGDFLLSSGSLNQTVNAATTTSVAGAPNPSVFGQPVVITATVTNLDSAVAPVGTVAFFDGLTPLGAGVPGTPIGNVETWALPATTALPSGPQSITAVFTSAPRFQNSMGTYTQDVQAITVTSIAGLPNPSTFGQPATLTAIVANTSGGASPTGTVEFFADNGTINLGPGSALTAGGNMVTSTLTTTAIPAGVNQISAVYTPAVGADFVGSIGTGSQTVTPTTTTTAAGSPNPSIFGQPVVVTATVTNTSSAAAPVGTVAFFDGLTPLGAGVPGIPIGNVETWALPSTTALPSGPQSITAVFTAAPGFLNSMGNYTQNVQAVTATSIAGSPNPSTFGQPVTLTATVANSSGGASPTGTVEFFADNGTINLGPGKPLTVGGNVVTSTLSTTAIPAGVNQISAVYTPTVGADFVSSTGTGSQTVNALTTTTVSGAPNPSAFGTTATLTATVADTSSGTLTPAGSVEFFDGAVPLGPGSRLTGSGSIAVSTFSISTLTFGPHTIRAVYTPTGNFLGSNGSATQVVSGDVTTTTIASGLNSSSFKQSVTFTATVNDDSGVGLPTGQVEFFYAATNTYLGTGSPLTGSGNVATSMFTTAILGPGHDAIAAVFVPSGVYVNSQAMTMQTVADPNSVMVVNNTLVQNGLPATPFQLRPPAQSVHSLFEAGTPTGAAPTIPQPGLILSTSTVVDGGGRTVTFAIAGDNSLWVFGLDGHNMWLELSTGSFLQISTATNKGGDAVAFGVMTDHSLWEFSSLISGGWALLSPTNTIASISAVTNFVGEDIVYAITADNHLWEHSPAGWGILSTDSFESVSAGLTPSGTAIVYGVLADHSLWEYNPEPGFGGRQELFGAGMVLSATAGSQGDVFAILADKTLWEHNANGSQELSTGSFASVSVSETEVGNLELFATLSDSSFWQYTNDPTVYPWQLIYGSGVVGSAAP